MLHALSPKTFLKNFQVSAKNQRMKPDNKIETERLSKAMNDTPMNNFSDQGQKEPPLCLLSLSGGMDSAVLFTYSLTQYQGRVLAVNFFYGSKHNEFEQDCARKLCEKYSTELIQIDLSGVGKNLSSSLLTSGGEIPEGRYNEESMKSTVVPARNMVFISILAGLAESKGVSIVSLGNHAGDHAIYPDCTPEFFFAMRKAVWEGTGKKVRFTAPLLYMTKTEILKYGLEHGTPFELTRTCYKDQALSCGKCGACTERLEAFEALKIKDPINYEN